MKRTDREDYVLTELILATIDGSADEQQCQNLNRILENDAGARAYYLEFMQLYVSINENIGGLNIRPEKGESDWKGSDSTLCEIVTRDLEDSAIRHAIEQVEDDEPEAVEGLKDPLARRAPNWKRVGVSIAAILAISLTLIWLDQYITQRSQIAPRPSVAVLDDAIQLRWDINGNMPSPGERMYVGRYHLEEGLVKLIFDKGTEVVVEGPAKFRLQENGMHLSRGKAFAVVPESGSGFVVDLPNSRVVDLGTAFGVQVAPMGNTLVQVEDGRVRLESGLTKRTVQVLDEHQARRISTNGSHVSKVAYRDDMFAQKIDSQGGFIWRGDQLNLADVVGGGKGFGGGQPGWGIDFQTGAPIYIEDIYGGVDRLGYVRCENNQYIDGVFVPGQGDAVQVSSEKHFFDGFDKTSARFWVPPIYASYRENDRIVFQAFQLDKLKLDRHLRSKNALPAIYLHSNGGVTFDLDAMRTDLRDLVIERFRATCMMPDRDRGSTVNAWVLLDGKLAMDRIKAVEGVPYEVDIPIKPTQRFLTLAITAGSDKEISWDLALFGNPVLTLKDRYCDLKAKKQQEKNVESMTDSGQ